MSKKSTDAADAAKVAGLASILKANNTPKEQLTASPSPALPPESAIQTALPPARLPKRTKIGKYRDPNWHHYGVYLRKDTHRKANRLLEDTGSPMDMSELLQTLLEQWLANH